MLNELEHLTDWLDENSNYRFVGLHKAALLFGISRRAIDLLVESRSIDFLCIKGKYYIPISLQLFNRIGYIPERNWAELPDEDAGNSQDETKSTSLNGLTNLKLIES